MIQARTSGAESLVDRAEEWQARAIEVAWGARSRLIQADTFLKDTMTKQPARAVGVALGLGVALGWLIKRR